MFLRIPLVAAVLAALACPAAAATFTPTRFDDPLPNGCLVNDCSLREAVIAAEATLATDTIQLAAGTYQLTRTSGTEAQSYDLDITRGLTIVGSLAGSNITNATAPGAQSRVIDATGTKLTLQRVGLRGGNVGNESGGCLRATNSGVNLDTASIALCTAANGGGASATGGSLWLYRSNVYRNTGSAIALSDTTLHLATSRIFDNAGDRGGGVYVHGEGMSSRIESTGTSAIESNVASTGGGMMVEWGSDAEIIGPAGGWLTLSQNEAILGGGLLNGFGKVTISNVAVLDNIASDLGGGLWASGIDATRMRVEGNTAYNGGGAYVGCGGGMHPCRIAQSSFASNLASADGGGILHSSGTVLYLENVSSYANTAQRGGGIMARSTVHLTHVTSYQDAAGVGPSLAHELMGGGLTGSILRNSALLGGCAALGGAVLLSEGGNAQIAGTPSCSLTASSDRPTLSSGTVAASYGDYGGGMNVVGIPFFSTLVNRGLATWCEPLDARGYLRPSTCDIGAFEVSATAP